MKKIKTKSKLNIGAGNACPKESVIHMLEAGIKGRIELTVDESVSAKRAASGEMDVFGTPYVIALMEQTADKFR